MKLQILLTGNEVMSGDVVDSNSAMIAQALSGCGWAVDRKVTVPDELDTLVREILAMCHSADVLIINGGLGPTVDDLTAEAMAVAAGVERQWHDKALAELDSWCEKRGLQMNDANRKQAFLPAGADIIANERGSAPGIRLEIEGCLVLATPGVPSELRQMLGDEIMPLLQTRFDSDRVEVRRLAAFGIGESTLQQQIDTLWPDWPDAIDLGFRASIPTVEIKLTARGDATAALDLWQQRMVDYLADAYIGPAPLSLGEAAVGALQQGGKTVTTAESCTGGRIAAALTGVPGASEVFHGGIVSYSNAMKRDLLGVSAEDLDRHGAVSEVVAKAMARGALEKSGADIAVAVTGIAGPGGGTPEKPAGTVWIAWGDKSAVQAVQLHLKMDREGFQQWTTALCLDLIRRQGLGIAELPSFIRRYRRQ